MTASRFHSAACLSPSSRAWAARTSCWWLASLRRSWRARARRLSRGGRAGLVAAARELSPDLRISDDAARCIESVLPPDLLAVGVGAPVVIDPDLVDAPRAPRELGGHLGLEAETVLAQRKSLDHFAAEDLVTGLHVGQVQVGEEV